MRQFESICQRNGNAGRLGLLLPLLSCALIVFSGGGCRKEVESAATASTPQVENAGTDTGAGAEAKVLVTYFHTTVRCLTCHRLEEYSRETVETAFARQLEQGKVVFRVINIQEPENQHYIQEYKLYTKSLIVSEVKDGKEIRWKNLPEIWKLVRDREQYEKYVVGEIEAYLKDL